MIDFDAIPILYGPYKIIIDINEVADQYWPCRSPARARRRLDKKGIVGRILLGMPSVSLVGTILRVHPYHIKWVKAGIVMCNTPGASAEEVLRRALCSPLMFPRMWRPERDA